VAVAESAEAILPFQQHEKQRRNIDQPAGHHFPFRLQPRLKLAATTAGKHGSTVNNEQGRPS